MTCLDKGGAALRTDAVRSTAAVKASAGVTAMTREAAWSGNKGRFNFRICWKSSRASAESVRRSSSEQPRPTSLSIAEVSCRASSADGVERSSEDGACESGGSREESGDLRADLFISI